MEPVIELIYEGLYMLRVELSFLIVFAFLWLAGHFLTGKRADPVKARKSQPPSRRPPRRVEETTTSNVEPEKLQDPQWVVAQVSSLCRSQVQRAMELYRSAVRGGLNVKDCVHAKHEKGSVASRMYQDVPSISCTLYYRLLSYSFVSYFNQFLCPSGVTKGRNCYPAEMSLRTCRRMNANSSIPIWWQLSFAWDRLMKLWACLRTQWHIKFDSDSTSLGIKQTQGERRKRAKLCSKLDPLTTSIQHFQFER